MIIFLAYDIKNNSLSIVISSIFIFVAQRPFPSSFNVFRDDVTYEI